MSTRCQIGFYDGRFAEEPSAIIYRHSDGYPSGGDGVLAVLVPWARDFAARRGLQDAAHAAASALYALIRATLGTEMGDDAHGYAIDNHPQNDLSFYYRVDPDEITVYRYTSTGKRLFSVPIKSKSPVDQPRDKKGRFMSARR